MEEEAEEWRWRSSSVVCLRVRRADAFAPGALSIALSLPPLSLAISVAKGRREREGVELA